MAELLAEAYADLRTQRIADYQLEVRNDSDAQVVRLDGSDPRLTITDDPGNAAINFVLVLSGSDGDITLPVTLNSTVLYNPENDPMTPQENFNSPFILGSSDDEVTITHTVELPV